MGSHLDRSNLVNQDLESELITRILGSMIFAPSIRDTGPRKMSIIDIQTELLRSLSVVMFRIYFSIFVLAKFYQKPKKIQKNIFLI
jgi:hypothetical protein